MPTLHFLNVRDGDCTIIQHGSGRITMVDVNNARIPTKETRQKQSFSEVFAKPAEHVGGNFNQKQNPENPIEYMRTRSIDSIFRFVLTHPDMDHMDGIADLFAEFSPPNVWDTNHRCDKDSDDWDAAGCRYRREDWEFYKSLRGSQSDPKHLIYHSGEPQKQYWGEDGLCVLSPTPALIAAANERGEWNDSSYVLLYVVNHKDRSKPSWKIVITGDSHDETWEHILDVHAKKMGQIDLLRAPHHGRDSDRNYDFLDVLKPRLTLFGNARSEHLGNRAWNSRGLPIISNNQAGSIVVEFDEDGSVWSTHKPFAVARLKDNVRYHNSHRAWLTAFIR